jgi:The GLUG motif
MCVLGLCGTAAGADFAGGTGESNDPYQIATAEQLIAMGRDADLYDKHFALVGDIDLDPNLPGGRVFDLAVIAPDANVADSGFQGTPFMGGFDGRGHAIRRLVIVSSHEYAGLFGKMESPGTIQNLTVTDVSIQSTFEPEGDDGFGIGALAGENWGVITGCFSTGSVQGTYDVGGLVGDNRGTIFNCYSLAAVRAAGCAGGLVGSHAGGVIAACYAGGSVSCSGQEWALGGLVGSDLFGTIVGGYFLDPNDGGGPINGSGSPLTDLEMRQPASFLDWDLYGTDTDGALNMWFVSEGAYPVLSWQTDETNLIWLADIQAQSLADARNTIENAGLVVGRLLYDCDGWIPADSVVRVRPAHPVAVGTAVDIVVGTGACDWSTNAGDGTEARPYQIAGAGQLEAMGQFGNCEGKYFALVADIDLTGYVYTQAVIAPDANDLPSESSTRTEDTFDEPCFVGFFDGRGHNITGLTVVSASEYAGLFGKIDYGGEVCDLAVREALVIGRIRPSENDAARSAGSRRCGAGVLAGENAGRIGGCIGDGLVIGTRKVGGLVGENRRTIAGCYSAACAVGRSYVGGLVGINSGGIHRSYSIGPVLGEIIGGLTSTSSYGTVRDCFWDVEASGSGTSGGGTGLNTEQMMDAEVYSLNGWAGDPNWVIDNGRDYPRLAWEGTSGQVISETVIDWFFGSGTPEDPYQISAADQLALIGTASILWDKHFVLANDLDLAGIDHHPIGVCRGTGFEGNFDGRGHIVSGLTVEETLVRDHLGLFGYVDSSGLIVRLGIQDANVVGENYLGALTAYNMGTIQLCFATGLVTGQDYLGGLVGLNGGRITDCYALGSVHGGKCLGGLIGGDAGGFVAHCYAASSVTTHLAHAWDLGGLVGDWSQNLIYTYHRRLPEERSSLFWGVSLSDAELRQRDSFVGWDFWGTDADGAGDHWYLPQGDYPVLTWQTDVTGLRVIPSVHGHSLDGVEASFEKVALTLGGTRYDYDEEIPAGDVILTCPNAYAPVGGVVDVVLSSGPYDWNTNPGAGTEAAPYLIETPGQLGSLRNHSELGSSQFLLTADIDMSGRFYTGYLIDCFRGVFDGGEHRIMHLTGSDFGFFGGVWIEAVVCNLVLDRVRITNIRGGVLGSGNSGSIFNCHLGGWIVSETNWGCGGLIGNNNGIVANSSVSAAIVGIDGIWGFGGLVGENNGLVTACCANGGAVYGQGSIWGLGGLVGQNNGTVTDCYSSMNLVNRGAAWDVGGLVGENNGDLLHCWSDANIINTTSSMWRPGQLAGSSSGAVTSCYYPGFAYGNGDGPSLSEAAMRRQSSFVGWDFAGETENGTDDIWTICEGQDYPRLWWEEIECEP